MKKAHTVIYLFLYFFLPTSVAIAESRDLFQSIRDLDGPFKSGYVDFKCEKDTFAFGADEIIFSVKKEFLGYRVRIKQDLNWIEVPLTKELNELGFEFKVTEKVEGKNINTLGLSFDDDIAKKFLRLNYHEALNGDIDAKYDPHVEVKKRSIESSLHVRIDFMSRKMKTSQIFVDDFTRVRFPAQLNWDRSISELVKTRNKIERLRDELLAELRKMEAVPNLYFGTYRDNEWDKDSKLSIFNIAYDGSLRKKITEMLKVAEPFLQDFELLDEAQKNRIIPHGFSKKETNHITFKGRFAADAYEEIRLTIFPDDKYVVGESEFPFWKHSKEKIAAYFDLLEIHLNNTIQFAMMEIDFLLANTNKLPEDHFIELYVPNVEWKGFKLGPYATYNCALMAY